MVKNTDITPNPADRILMITPFHRSQRGNTLTSERLKYGLSRMGFNIDLLSLEDDNYQETLEQLLHNHQYSLVHGFHGRHFGNLLDKLPSLLKLPLVLTMTGTDIHIDLNGENMNSVLKCMSAVHHIIVFNEQFRVNIASMYPEYRNKLSTIPQGVILKDGPVISRQDLGLQENDFLFLLPSGLRRVKNLELPLDALEELHDDFPQVKLLIMGAEIDENYEKLIKKRIQNLPWAYYLGEIPHSTIKSYYQLGDAVLNTSLSEGQPQAAVEAMSLGIPAILTAAPGNLGIIENGVHGFYVADKVDLIKAAKPLVLDSKLKNQMGLAAQKMVQNKFSAEQEFSAHASVYRSLLR